MLSSPYLFFNGGRVALIVCEEHIETTYLHHLVITHSFVTVGLDTVPAFGAGVHPDKHRSTRPTGHFATLNNSVFMDKVSGIQVHQFVFTVCLFTCVHSSLDPVLLLDLGGVIGQCIQNLMEVACGLIQPFDRIPEFIRADFTG